MLTINKRRKSFDLQFYVKGHLYIISYARNCILKNMLNVEYMNFVLYVLLSQ